MNRVLYFADERQRRLIAGLEAVKMGRGGVSRVAEITGLTRGTIRQGVRELKAELGRTAPEGRVRREGGGRPSLKKKTPRS